MKHRLILCFFVFLFTVHFKAEYVLYEGYDSPGGDMAVITNKTRKQKQAYCNALADCQGFNTKGNIKNSLLPTSSWIRWTFEQYEGLYRKITDFVFTQGLDSPGSEIANLAGQTVAQLKVYCHEHPECVGFNTLGSIRSNASPQSQWTRFSDDPKAGFYLRKDYIPQAQDQSGAGPDVATTTGGYQTSPIPSGYNFAPQLDSNAGNIKQVLNQTPDQLKAICDANPRCLGFNTDGWLKSSLKPKAEWGYFGTSSNEGLYYKKGYAPSTKPFTYTVYQGQDSSPYDLTVLPDRTIEELQAFCDDTPHCLAFNTAGRIKFAVSVQSKFLPTPDGALYIKNTDLSANSNTAQTPSEYNFASQLDSASGNLKQFPNYTPDQLKAICDANPACMGFNTDGWLKSSLKPKWDWSRFGTSSKEGLYYKKGYTSSATPFTYTTYQNQDSFYSDLTNLPGRTLQEVQAFCDDTPNCVAFNSDGWVKYAVSYPTRLDSYYGNTLYIKTERAPLGQTLVTKKGLSSRDLKQLPDYRASSPTSPSSKHQTPTTAGPYMRSELHFNAKESHLKKKHHMKTTN